MDLKMILMLMDTFDGKTSSEVEVWSARLMKMLEQAKITDEMGALVLQKLTVGDAKAFLYPNHLLFRHQQRNRWMF